MTLPSHIYVKVIHYINKPMSEVFDKSMSNGL